MARRKRPYVPKVKGCYECSQRRIDCDGTRPSCTKCTSRGLECSGFGVKFKFRNAFGAGRKAAAGGNELGVGSGSGSGTKRNPSRPPSDADSRSTTPASARIPSVKPISHEVPYSTDEFSTPIDDSPFDFNLLSLDGSLPDSLPLISLNFPSDEWSMFLGGIEDGSSQEIGHVYGIGEEKVQDDGDKDEDGDDGRGNLQTDNELLTQLPNVTTSQAMVPSKHTERSFNKLFISPNLGQMDSWKQFLVTYFSEYIAPEMVVVDDKYNGWRQYVLPVACADELVMSSVLAVSAFHLNGRLFGKSSTDPTKLYAEAIRGLQNRKDLATCDKQTKQLIVVAIVVLLVAVMVNGCSDFPILFYMLESALQASGGEEDLLDDGELAQFSRRQIHKMRVYAAPLLSQDQGLQAILCQAQESFDCLHYYVGLHPEHSSAFGVVADLRQQAFNIYLNRVLTGGENPQAEDLIDRFVRTVQSFPEGSPGENVLVWPVFIAASESMSSEHRSFFQQFLERHHQRNGFGNILKALDLLKKIWSRDDSQDWPALLPEPQVFIM